MKLKSLLFGSAAAIVAISGAQAADLPVAEPVEYVQICDAYGAGYFYIPGGDTCLRINGYVEGNAAYLEADGVFSGEDDDEDDGIDGDGDNFNEFGTRARGDLTFTAKTSTELGVLTSVFRYRGSVNTLPEREVILGEGVFAAGDTFNVVEAYLQLEMEIGRVVSGHTASAFDFFGSASADLLGVIDDPTGEVNLLAFEATFGSFSAIVSLEDPFSGAHGRRDDFDEGFDVGGTDFPDLVGALQFNQAWGGVQLSGAVGQVSDVGGEEELGWAVALGGSVGVGIITASAQATYADGLIGYVTECEGFIECSDGDIDGDNLDTNTAWSIRAGLSAGVTEALEVGVSGSYTDYNDEDSDDGDAEYWGVDASATYTVVPGLSLTGNVGYGEVENEGGEDGEL